MAVAAGALLLTVGTGILVDHSRSNEPHLGAPGVSPSASPPVLPDNRPAYTKLPNPCSIPGKVLPADARVIEPRHIADSCTWQKLGTVRSRNLSVHLELEEYDRDLGPGAIRAADYFTRDLAYAANARQNGGLESAPEHLSGPGDEAFADRSTGLILRGRTEKTAKAYNLAGAKVEARSRNVVITVEWQGEDYPPAVRGSDKLAGTPLSYSKSKQQTLAVVTYLLGELA